MTLVRKPFENVVAYGENAVNQHFLLFPCFLPYQRKINVFSLTKEKMTKLSKREENTVGKGQIALTSNFSFFHSGFQKACFPGASKGVIVWERVKRH